MELENVDLKRLRPVWVVLGGLSLSSQVEATWSLSGAGE